MNTIVSDNCFGVVAYDKAPEAYKSPFINVDMAYSAIGFMKDIRTLDLSDIRELKFEEYVKIFDEKGLPIHDDYLQEKIPCCLIGGKYSIFLPHVETFDDYKAIYFRRMERFSFDDMVFKVGCSNLKRNGYEENIEGIRKVIEVLSPLCKALVITDIDRCGYGAIEELEKEFSLINFDDNFYYNDNLLLERRYEFTNFGKPRKLPEDIKFWLLN